MKVGSVSGKPHSTWVAAAFCAVAMGYVLAGLGVAIALSPRVPYADAWRHYARLLNEPFPASVLAADNGHPELFANLVRLADLRWLAGDERWQIATGLLLALGAFAILACIVWRDRRLPLLSRSAAFLALALGVFWLGNARALTHDNETLHVYSVFVCLALAMRAAIDRGQREPQARSRVAIAAALCALAAFNFGSGSATFLGLLAVLWMQRARASAFAVVGVAMVATAAIYLAIAGRTGAPVTLQPFDRIVLALRWLAAPLQYLLWPFVDPAAASALPAPLARFALPLAGAWTSVFGDVRVSVWPQAFAGTLFLLTLLGATIRVRRRADATGNAELLGLALAWFGAGVAALVAVSRMDYFAASPAQVYAPRYLPWSSLAWAGLLVAAIARKPRRRLSLWVVTAVAVFALAAEVGMTMAMRHQNTVAEDAALAGVVGVLPDIDQQGEIVASEMVAGLRALRRIEAGPFAWPEARVIGADVPGASRAVAIREWTAQPSHSALGEQGMRIEAQLAATVCPQDRLLIVAGGRVVGLLRALGHDRWRGVASITPGAAVDVVEMRCP